MDDFDLRISLAANKDIAETAAFLCHSLEETQARADELGITHLVRVSKDR